MSKCQEVFTVKHKLNEFILGWWHSMGDTTQVWNLASDSLPCGSIDSAHVQLADHRARYE